MTQEKVHLVAVGASAGGLEPLQEYFSNIQPDPNTIHVVIQHLSPDYKSMMGELLSRSTQIPIHVAEDGMQAVPGNIYLIPPAYNIFMKNAETFGLVEKTPGTVNLPINIFVSSATQIFRENTVVIILSGTGSDGTRGIVEANAAGGLTLCQSPETCQFDGMPRSALATGFIDDTGDASFLAHRVYAHIMHEITHVDTRKNQSNADAVELQDILGELKTRTDIPFDEYKQTTVSRRIERRMALRHITTLAGYLRLIRNDDSELDTLRRETLIGVTSFFRDPDSFEALQTAAREQVQNRESGDEIRIWVAGCSTGEEAYSIVMIYDEVIRESGKRIDLKVFATDLEQTYLDHAAAGTYPASISAEVSATRLKEFFQPVAEQFRVSPELRKRVIFAKHNMITDAPFTRMDLVSCRNVLIYFQNQLQERVLRRFQYALSKGGLLYLGSSETLGVLQRDFSAVSSKAKVFRTLRPSAISLEALQAPLSTGVLRAPGPRKTPGSPIDEAQRLLVEKLSPPTLLLSSDRQIVHVFGDVSAFFRLPIGEISLDASRMMDTIASTSLIRLFKELNAQKGSTSVFSETLRLNNEDRYFKMRLTAVDQAQPESSMLLLSFHEISYHEDVRDDADTSGDNGVRMDILKQELAVTRQNLQNTIEELEASNEELQATNEELLASNEELQSTNEELQSVNEELYTVNSEYQEKIRILDRLNADLDTMADAAGIPTLFLDEATNIVRFTRSITEIYPLKESDIGRSLEEISSRIGYSKLIIDAKEALANLKSREVVWQDASKGPILIRIVPYAEKGYGTNALVIMFIDINNLDRSDFLQNVLDALPEHVAVIDEFSQITMTNAAWNKFAAENGGDPQSTGIGSNYAMACKVKHPKSDGDASMKQALQGITSVLEGSREQFVLEYPCHSPTEKRWFQMTVSTLNAPRKGAIISHVNISNWVSD